MKKSDFKKGVKFRKIDNRNFIFELKSIICPKQFMVADMGGAESHIQLNAKGIMLWNHFNGVYLERFINYNKLELI